jgi:UDP-N-acetylmuramoyl-tripeptide--D-alanyl-D-alanine ligase
MDRISLSQIAEMAGARILQGSPEMLVSSVSKDSRTIQHGDLYVALRGENFDGNAYASDALARGAAAVLLDSAETAHSISSQHPVLLVENGLAALTRLAAAWRSKLKLKVVGITGSSGKTSTKDFTAAVLGSRLKVVKTSGNLNNHIGVPLSILAASSEDEVAVWEVGMNHPGEIAPLAALIKPDCVIITNIGVAHIEHMKTRDAIALEKGMLAESVNPSGAVILVSEDDKTDSIAERSPAKVIRVGFTKGDLVAESIESDEKGTAFTIIHQGKKYDASIPVHGSHMVQNALLAIAAGLELGIPLASAIKALSRAKPSGGRLEQKTLRGVLYLDDTYNANPDSMEAALHTLRQINGQGRRIAVLGKMGELGDYAAEGYQRTGTAAGKFADILITVGKEASAIATSARKAGLGRIHEVEETSAAARMLEQLARPGDIVLVKGSRSARMETLFQHIPN